MLWFIGFVLLAVGVVTVGLVKTSDRRVIDRGPDPRHPIERRVNSLNAMGGALHPDEF